MWLDQITQGLVHLPLWLALLPAGRLPWEPGQLQACSPTPARHNSPAPQRSPLPHSSGSIWSLWRWPVSRASRRQRAHRSGSGAAGHVGQRGPMGPVAPDWREGRGPQGPSRAGAVSGRRVRSCWAPKPAAASCYVWLRQTQTPGPQGGHSWPRPGRRWLGEADRRGADGGRVPSSPSLGVPRGQSPRRGCWSGSGAAGAWPGWTERRWGSRLPLSVRTRKPQLRAAAGLPGRPRAVRDGGRKLTFHGLEHSICTRSLDPGAQRGPSEAGSRAPAPARLRAD